MPNAAINMIPDFEDHTIIINERNNLGIDATTAMDRINETLSITIADVTKFYKTPTFKDCAIHTLREHEEKCPMVQMQPNTEKWTITPIKSVIFVCLILDKLFSLPTEENKEQHSGDHPCSRGLLYRDTENNNQDDEGKIINFKNHHQDGTGGNLNAKLGFYNQDYNQHNRVPAN